VLLRYILNPARKWNVLSASANPAAGLSMAPEVHRQRFLTAVAIYTVCYNYVKQHNSPERTFACWAKAVSLSKGWTCAARVRRAQRPLA
jgi:hypothetical protein